MEWQHDSSASQSRLTVSAIASPALTRSNIRGDSAMIGGWQLSTHPSQPPNGVSAIAIPALTRSNARSDSAIGERQLSSGATSESLIRASAIAIPALTRGNTRGDSAIGEGQLSSGARSKSLIRVPAKTFPALAKRNTLRDSAIRVWYLDSGATRHICAKSDQMLHYMSIAPKTILGIGDQALRADGVNNLALLYWLFEECRPTKSTILRDVLHVPAGHVNLVSVARLNDAGLRVKPILEHARHYASNHPAIVTLHSTTEEQMVPIAPYSIVSVDASSPTWRWRGEPPAKGRIRVNNPHQWSLAPLPPAKTSQNVVPASADNADSHGVIYVALYVHDLIIISSSMKLRLCI